MAEKVKRYAIACPTSMGIRLTPVNRESVHLSKQYIMQATSAESNVLNVSASLGCTCLALTKFVEGSPVSTFIQSELRARNIHYEGLSIPQEGPWGYRHQINIADSGFGSRGPRVWNDRAGEVGRTLSMQDFDIDRIFGEEGVSILHISGLVAALSPETSAFCTALAQKAKSYGTLISFDVNHRASFWKNREEELERAFHELALLSDILVGNEEDFQLTLRLKGPEIGGKGLSGQIEGFKDLISEASLAYPHIQYYANTLRQVIHTNEHLWGAMLYTCGQWYIEEPRPVHVLDRIGGGDGFTSGLLYGIYKNMAPAACLKIGWASGVLAVSTFNDYASPADEEELLRIYDGNARVKR